MTHRAQITALVAFAWSGLGCTTPTPDPTCAPELPAVVNATLAMDLDRTSWSTGVAVQGLVTAAACLEGAEADALDDALVRWSARRVAEAGAPNHVNWGAVGGALFGIAARLDDPDGLALARTIAIYMREDHPRVDGGALVHSGDQLWVDTTWMVTRLYTSAALEADDERFVDDLVLQLVEHAARLQDPDTGLFRHGWDLSDAAAGLPPYAAGSAWGRGNGWAALALTTTLEALAPEDPRRASLATIAQAQLDALVEHQAASGAWRTVIDDPTAYEESSATVAILISLTIAIDDLGEPGGLEVRPTWRAARDAASQFVREHIVAGELLGVSASTSLQDDPADYGAVEVGPAQPWGQGLTLLWLARP